MSKTESEEKAMLTKALHHSVGKICRNEQQQIELENEAALMSQSALSALTQMTYHYVTKCLASDLASFSSHAGRKTITSQDVILAARKRPQLMDRIRDAGIAVKEHQDLFIGNRNRDKKMYQVEINEEKNSSSEASEDIEDGSSDLEYNGGISKFSGKRKKDMFAAPKTIRLSKSTLSDTSSSEEMSTGSLKRFRRRKLNQNVQNCDHVEKSAYDSVQKERSAEGKSVALAIELSEDDD